MLTAEPITMTQVIFLAVTGVLCIGLPVAAAVYWRKTRHARLFPLLVGALIFVVFARVLEAGLHYFCIIADNPVSRTINASTWLYALCEQVVLYSLAMLEHNSREACHSPAVLPPLPVSVFHASMMAFHSSIVKVSAISAGMYLRMNSTVPAKVSSPTHSWGVRLPPSGML